MGWWALALVAQVGCSPGPAADTADAAARAGDPAPAARPEAPAHAADGGVEARLWAAYRAAPPDEPPATRHLRPDGRPQHINRLVLEASPYLRQHAHDPVDWYPWGEEALERARRLDRPILLSVGYATCHWCHVMARESFQDAEIAAFINAHFVPVKVDREARPDLDAVYLRAQRLLSSGSGWPLTAVLTPDGRPYFAGTYLPPRDGDRGARKGFLTVLRELSAAYRDERPTVLERASLISRRLRSEAAPRPPAAVPGPDALRATFRRLARTFDAKAGGFGRGPKFPRPSTLAFLLRYARRAPDSEARAIVEATLSRMAQGALRDHLGGGFHRYTEDPRWRVPHFEKMLYDQAQLVGLYLDASQATGRADLAAVARETLAAMLRDFALPDGGFASALDAESRAADGSAAEGLYYTWTRPEVEAALGAEAEAFAKAYRVTPRGAIGGRSVLRRPLDTPDLTNGSFVDARRRLLAARSARRAPRVDSKVVVAWNGLALSALARAALALDDAALRARAEALGAYLLDHARRPDGRLGRLVRDGAPHGPGVLEDHAFVVQGLLDLFEATGARRWHAAARALQTAQDAHFAAPEGGYFHTAGDHEALLLRTRPVEDGAEPSGNAVSALNLLRLAELANDEGARARAHGVFAAFAALAVAGAPGLEGLASALDFALEPARQIIVVGPEPTALLGVVRRTYVPNRALVVVDAPGDHPLAADKPPREGRATAYVCRQGRCERPTNEPAELERQLAAAPPVD